MSSKKVFISYSLHDELKVKRIKKDIEAAGHFIWIYPEAIDVGDHIVNSEQEGIRDSDFVVLMLSAKSKSSKAVKKEIELTKREEKRKGIKKLLIVNIDSGLQLRNKDAIQICDLSNASTYARELHKLLNKIKEHKNFVIRQIVKRYRGKDSGLFGVCLKLQGPNLKFVKEVDYHMHPEIASDEETYDYSDDPNKKFSIYFDTFENEIVYAIIKLKDGTTEEIRHYVKLI